MKKIAILSVTLLLVAGLAIANDEPNDPDGYFDIFNVTINGDDWGDFDVPEVTEGETYTVAMDVVYNDDIDLDPFFELYGEETYSSSMFGEIRLPWLAGLGPVVWTASDATPLVTPDSLNPNNPVWAASWHLESSLVVPDVLIEGPRLAGLTIGTDLGLNDVVDFEIRVADIGGGAPVPEPSTMLLLGAGLVGLIGFSRRKRKV